MKRIFSTDPISHHHLRQCAVDQRKALIKSNPHLVVLIEKSTYGWTVFKGGF